VAPVEVEEVEPMGPAEEEVEPMGPVEEEVEPMGLAEAEVVGSEELVEEGAVEPEEAAREAEVEVAGLAEPGAPGWEPEGPWVPLEGCQLLEVGGEDLVQLDLVEDLADLDPLAGVVVAVAGVVVPAAVGVVGLLPLRPGG
jgi:hypothetical protein